MTDEIGIVQTVARRIAEMYHDGKKPAVLHIGHLKAHRMLMQVSGNTRTLTIEQGALYEMTMADGTPRMIGRLLGLDLYTSNDEEECRVAEWGD